MRFRAVVCFRGLEYVVIESFTAGIVPWMP